jgi:hypothetical protein
MKKCPKQKRKILNYFNNSFIKEIKKKWSYNENMPNRFVKCGYDRAYTTKVMEQLSVHYDIEVINDRNYFKELDWKIVVPNLNSKAREISLHNFSILKDQILLKQHNPLYN